MYELDVAERKRYRDWGLSSSVVCHRSDQRISVISSTSSNTTSGIVSDRVHSLDESEGKIPLFICKFKCLQFHHALVYKYCTDTNLSGDVPGGSGC